MTFDLETLAQLTANGLLLAGIYALMAFGLNVIFGVLRVLNMAHGELLMLGAFGAFWVWRGTGANPLVAIVLLAPAFFAIGYAFQYYVMRRVTAARMPLEDSSLLLTYGFSLALVALARELWSSDYRSVPFMRGSWRAGSLFFSYSQTAAFVAAAVIMVALIVILYRTRLGRAIRATADDRELAAACGVAAQHAYAVAFGLGAVAAGAAGVMLSMMFAIYPEMGLDYSIRAFVIVILGGLGSLGGAFVGSIALGLVETFGAFYMGALPATILPFIIILAVLFLRPAGIRGFVARST